MVFSVPCISINLQSFMLEQTLQQMLMSCLNHPHGVHLQNVGNVGNAKFDRNWSGVSSLQVQGPALQLSSWLQSGCVFFRNYLPTPLFPVFLLSPLFLRSRSLAALLALLLALLVNSMRSSHLRHLPPQQMSTGLGLQKLPSSMHVAHQASRTCRVSWCPQM